MNIIDWVEVSNIFFASVVSAIITNIIAYSVQKLIIEKKLQQSLELFKVELQKTRDTETRNLLFIERQLEEFYSPMIGYLMKIKAKSALKLKISQVSDEAWKELCAGKPKPFHDHEKYFEPYKRSLEYDNKLLEEEIIPLYDQMVNLFTEKYWLANPSTRDWQTKFSEFVDLWHRWLDNSIPADVIRKMNHSEEKLKPFYADLENQLNQLQKVLTQG